MIDNKSNNIGEPVAPAPIPSETPTPAPATDNTSDTIAEATATNDNSPAVAVDTSDTTATPDNSTPAPAVGTLLAADKVLAGMVSARNSAPATPAVGTLPADYLRGGYYRGEGKSQYLDPALVDHAEAIGTGLAAGGVTPTAFNRMVKVLKGAAKLPLPGQLGALKKLLPLALKEKKAPPLLREVVERNRAAVQNEADFAACLDHFQDVAIFLAAATQATK